MEERKRQNKQHQREVRCPVHGRLLGKYDARSGIINVTYYCPLCRREYTFTVKREDEK